MAAYRARQTELHRLAPPGLIVTRKWLIEQGLTRHALDNQVKSHQFVPVLPGVYTRPYVTLFWQNLVCSLTSVLDTGLHLGGISALSLQGFAHYMALSDSPVVHLYGEKAPPVWANKVVPGVEVIWHSTKRLWGEGAELVVSKYTVDFSWRDDLPPMKISSSEQAYLELLMGVPGAISFEHADEVMQGLTQLSPRKLDEMLSVCKSVKAKRLFFWMADRHHYAWRRKLNIEDYDLGKGKRVIAKAGKLDATYQITVPGAMYG